MMDPQQPLMIFWLRCVTGRLMLSFLLTLNSSAFGIARPAPRCCGSGGDGTGSGEPLS